MNTDWLRIIAILWLVIAGLSAITIIMDLASGHRQHMWIMDVVWPVTALYAGPLALYAYFKIGRLSSQAQFEKANAENRKPPGMSKPFWQSVALGATHCGSGCALGDIVAEWFLFFVPFTLFGEKIFAAWLVDYILAFSFGIAFQYFTIKPMKGLSVGQGLVAAVKADTLSLTAWQVGMYGWMAIAVFVIFRHEIPKTDPVFWFMMQIAMLCGFVTAYPVNGWLVRKGIKETM
jgi:hypothetical protein